MSRALTLRLDARGWNSREDMWRALRNALGAPEWHGDSLDARCGSLVSGLNRIRPPLVVKLLGVARCPAALVAYLTRVREVFADAGFRAGRTGRASCHARGAAITLPDVTAALARLSGAAR